VVPLASRASYEARYAEPDKAARQGTVAGWQIPYWLVDTSFATMLLLLGVAQEGLGALFFSLHRPPGPLLEAIGVPPGWDPLGAVAIGWPAPDDRAATSAARPRRPLEEVVHRGRWRVP